MMRYSELIALDILSLTETMTIFQEHPKNLIPELLRLFYTLDWVTGTGGGITIKKG